MVLRAKNSPKNHLTFSRYDKQLKRFMKKFNEVRDLDVQLEHFEALKKPLSRVLSRSILRIRNGIAKRRQEVVAKLQKYLQARKSWKTFPCPFLIRAKNKAR